MNTTRRTFCQGLALASTLAAVTIKPVFGQAPQFKMKFGSPFPSAHPGAARIKEAADNIRAETAGRVDIEIFANNQLGGDTEMLSQVRSGALEFMSTSGLILQTLVPVAGINGVPFAFKDYGQVWSAMDGDMGAVVRAGLGKANLYAFDKALDNGYRNITSNTKPINTVDDLKGFKIRVMMSPIQTSMFKAMGASPTSINMSELYSALQTKIVDGQENPLIQIDTVKLYEVQKFCSMTGHIWDGHWMLANGKKWASLPKDVQDIIARNFNMAAIKQREDVHKINEGLEVGLKKKGMIFNFPEVGGFRQALAKSGFYAEWKAKFGEQAWTSLEKYSGKLA